MAQAAAEAARDSTLTAFDNFDDRYLGAKASEPNVDNDGDPLLAGHFILTRPTTKSMQVPPGSAYVSGSGFCKTPKTL